MSETLTLPTLPDPQRVELGAVEEALTNMVAYLIQEGHMDDEDARYIWDSEPESHVFCSAECDDWGDPDLMETIMAVGERDLGEKIAWNRKTFRQLESTYLSPESENDA